MWSLLVLSHWLEGSDWHGNCSVWISVWMEHIKSQSFKEKASKWWWKIVWRGCWFLWKPILNFRVFPAFSPRLCQLKPDSQLFCLMSARSLITIINKEMWASEQLCCQQTRSFTWRSLEVQPLRQNESSTEKKKHTFSGLLLKMHRFNISSFIYCVFPVRKLVIHQRTRSNSVNWKGLIYSSSWMKAWNSGLRLLLLLGL